MKLVKSKSTKIITFILAVFLTVWTFNNIPVVLRVNAEEPEDIVYFVGTEEFNDLRAIVPSWDFLTLPSNYSCIGGTTVNLSIDVDAGDETPEYQWYLNNDIIRNATGNTLTIKNISVSYGGNYIVSVTIKDVTVKIGCVIDVVGGSTGKTEFISSESKRPEEPEPKEPDYNIIEITDNYDRVIREYNVSDLQITGNKLTIDIDASVDYVCNIYVKKLEELASHYKNGVLSLRFTGSKSSGNSNAQPSLDVPFNITKNISYAQSGDYRLAIAVKEASALSMESKLRRIYNNLSSAGSFYEISFEISEPNDTALKAVLTENAFELIYLNLPVSDSDFAAVMYDSASSRVYTLPSISEDNLMRFKVKNKSSYGTIKMNVRFRDIENHWAKDEIIKAASMLLVEGESELAYVPQADVTRAEFCTMLVRLVAFADIDTAKDIGNIYKDVAKGSWYYDYVQTAGKIGLLDFASDDYFEPDTPILREEMAAMTAKALQYAGVDTKQYNFSSKIKFADISEITSRFSRDVAICVNAGILKGMDDNAEIKFMPKKTHTRAEAAVVLNRIIDFIAK